MKKYYLTYGATAMLTATSYGQNLGASVSSEYKKIAPEKPLLPSLTEKADGATSNAVAKNKAQEAITNMMSKGKMFARHGEEVILPTLHGIVLIDEDGELVENGLPNQRGLDLSKVQIKREDSLRLMLNSFVGKPVSFESIGRIRLVVRHHLRSSGYPFSLVYTPPQDITTGSLQIFVKPSKIEQPLRVEGAKYFSEAQYKKGMNIDFNAAINQKQMNKDAARLSKNPYRNAQVITEAGSEPGTTALVLRTKETRPWRLNTGIDNTGTSASGENRIKAGFNWGNAFGRGDLLDYTYRTDPDFEFSQSHSLNYTTYLPWYHELSVFGAFSRVNSDLPAPLSQEGESWQLGARYTVPLTSFDDWEHSINYGIDFKSSNNNLSVSTTPVFDQLTNIFQTSVGYQISKQKKDYRISGYATLFASPGGINSSNDDAAFSASRAGAKSNYTYLNLGMNYAKSLGNNFTYKLDVRGQWASTNLIGSEQLGGSGVFAVRGYDENELFGDTGFVVRNEFLFPPIQLATMLGNKAVDELQGFLFADYALIQSHSPLAGEPSSSDIASVGLGINYRLKDNLTVSSNYGWQLMDSGNSNTDDSGKLHFNLHLSF